MTVGFKFGFEKDVDIFDYQAQTLSACVNYFSDVPEYENTGITFGMGNFSLNEEMTDKTVQKIAGKLALAVDHNSVEEVKSIKKEFGHLEEYKKAKELLNEKCKVVWSVFNPISNIPTEAMKTLGISNKPTLDFLLGNSVRFFEKSDTATTSLIISNTLNNKNLNYTMEEIHSYLAGMHRKEGCKYNLHTIQYLICEHNYNEKKLSELGISKNEINLTLKNMKINDKTKYIFENTKHKILSVPKTLKKLQKSF